MSIENSKMPAGGSSKVSSEQASNSKKLQVALDTCQRCEKPLKLCVCASIKPIQSQVHVLILQHPQEPDKELGSARLAHLTLPNSTLRVGLSWANLAKALGKEKVFTQDWAVLYLGSGIKAPTRGKSKGPGAPRGLKPGEAPRVIPPGLIFVDNKGEPKRNVDAQAIVGLVVIDGTWSQAKALWWRNPWLLKLKRAILVPSTKSMYGKIRREPRRECLSTIESIAEALTYLGEPKVIGENLRTVFGALLEKVQASSNSEKGRAP